MVLFIMDKSIKDNSFGFLYPDIASQVYDKTINVFNLAPHGRTKLKWQCSNSLEHTWETSINSRTNGHNCPYCSGNKASSENNITCNKKLNKEYDRDKNNALPEEITLGSNKKVYWTCSLGHSYKSSPKNRNRGQGCSYCSGKLASLTNNVTCNSKLDKEYDRDKNCIDPKQLTLNSGKKVWWKCSFCTYLWKASPNNRSCGSGCKICSKGNSSREQECIEKLIKDKFPEETIVGNGQKNINNRIIKPDIHFPDIMLIIEYYGDYWHCNPKNKRFNSPNYFHQIKKKTAQEIWDYDKERKNFLEAAGYQVEVIWESDWKSNKVKVFDNIVALISKIYNK